MERLIKLKSKGYYLPNCNNITEILSRNAMDKNFFYDPFNWTEEFRKDERNSWGVKEVNSFYGIIIEENQNNLKIKPSFRLNNLDSLLVSKNKIKEIK